MKALDEIDLTVERGELVAIVGSPGSEKTTFLNMVGGWDAPLFWLIAVKSVFM